MELESDSEDSKELLKLYDTDTSSDELLSHEPCSFGLHSQMIGLRILWIFQSC